MKHRTFLMNEFPLPLTSNSPWTPEGTPEKSMRIYFRWEKKTQVITISSCLLPVLFWNTSSLRCSASCPCPLPCDLPDRLSVHQALQPAPPVHRIFSYLSGTVCLIAGLLPPSRSSDAEYCFSSRSALGFSSLDKPFVFPEMGGTLWRRANEVSMGFFNWFWVGGHPYVLCWYKISFSSMSGQIMKCSVALATD